MPLRPVQGPVSCQVHGLKNVEVLRGTSLAVMSSETQHLSRAHHFIRELRLNVLINTQYNKNFYSLHFLLIYFIDIYDYKTV
jgi:hypothetical protein